MAKTQPIYFDGNKVDRRFGVSICKHLLLFGRDVFEPAPGEWTQVAGWFGLTLEGVTVRVSVKEGQGEIWWRREGFGRTPPATGRLEGAQVFHILPGDVTAQISLLPVGAKVKVELEQIA